MPVREAGRAPVLAAHGSWPLSLLPLAAHSQPAVFLEDYYK